MAHREQISFCLEIKNRFPEYFENVSVLDVGSLDINGNNQYLFKNCLYMGIDVAEGPNVDFVCLASQFNFPDESFDVIISTECFEHDMYYPDTLRNIFRILKKGGFFIFTCATVGRAEHGTRRTSPQDAPLLNKIENWCDYYKNLEESDIRACIDINSGFKSYEFSVNTDSNDMYFWGIKKGSFIKRSNYSFQIDNSWNRRVSEEILRVTSAYDAIAAREGELVERNGFLQAQVDDLIRSRSYLAVQINNLIQSRSWRYTRILRLFVSYLRKVKCNVLEKL